MQFIKIASVSKSKYLFFYLLQLFFAVRIFKCIYKNTYFMYTQFNTYHLNIHDIVCNHVYLNTRI